MRRVDRQAAVLGELRTRASIVLTATGIVASLLGGEVLNREHPFPWAFLPLVALAAGLLSCIAVLLPVRDQDPLRLGESSLRASSRLRALMWRRETDPREWQVTLGAKRLQELATIGDPNVVRGRIVEDLEGCAQENYATIRYRSRFLNAASLLLPAQIFLWVLVLWQVPPARIL